MSQLAPLISFVINALSILIFIRAILTWFIPDADHPAMRILIDLTEPVLRPIRRLMPQTMGFDFTPIVAIVGLRLLGTIIQGLAPPAV